MLSKIYFVFETNLKETNAQRGVETIKIFFMIKIEQQIRHKSMNKLIKKIDGIIIILLLREMLLCITY